MPTPAMRREPAWQMASNTFLRRFDSTRVEATYSKCPLDQSINSITAYRNTATRLSINRV